MKKQETKIERTEIDMAKAKVMVANSVWQDMKDNLSNDQMILYMSCMLNADVLGIVSGRDWMKVVDATEEDLKVLLELEFIYEIKKRRSYIYIVADWWMHNSLPAKRLRKTSVPGILDMLHVEDRVYNLTGTGTPAEEWLLNTKEDEDEEAPKTSSKKSEKPAEPKENPLYDEIVALWNGSYPEKPAPRHKPGTKIYNDILSAIIYAGEDNAKAAAAHKGAEMQCESWFNFDSIFSDSDKIFKLKSGNYDKAFGYVAQKLEYEKREAEKSKPKTMAEELTALGF